MRTPKPGTRTYVATGKTATAALHPWGKAPVRVWEQTDSAPHRGKVERK